jgi:N-sulfoglucosamine sulfohydrolase
MANLRELCIKLTPLLSIFLVDTGCLADGQADRPNLILIIADDMNWDDCGAYGHPHIRTPNIDRLAREGLRFEQAYLTASSCSPSRASIITGKYPHNTGAEQLHWPLPPHSVTFVQQLKTAGYYTAAAGKWHLGDDVKDHFDLVKDASTAGFQLPTGDGKQPPKMIAEKPSGCEDWLPVLKGRPKDKPFFLWLAALDPHREYEDGALKPAHKNSDVILPPYLPDTPEVRGDFRLYYDEIGRLDQYIGKVLRELGRQDVANNTVIMFISDNGRPFPREKTSLYDGGIRTPLIVRWPGGIEPDQVTKSLVSSVDIGPTFLELAGIEPADSFEGTSFLPILESPAAKGREFAFAEDHWHDYEDHARAVTDGRYKLIRNDYPDLAATPSADAGRSPTWQTMLRLQETGKLSKVQQSCFLSPRPKWELYDLKTDPHELTNLDDSKKHTADLKRLQTALSDWSKETDDYLPSKRTPDEFDRVTGEPDHSVRVRPRKSKREMFGTWGKY